LMSSLKRLMVWCFPCLFRSRLAGTRWAATKSAAAILLCHVISWLF
jgi:hypothetical protein